MYHLFDIIVPLADLSVLPEIVEGLAALYAAEDPEHADVGQVGLVPAVELGALLAELAGPLVSGVVQRQPHVVFEVVSVELVEIFW